MWSHDKHVHSLKLARTSEAPESWLASRLSTRSGGLWITAFLGVPMKLLPIRLTVIAVACATAASANQEFPPQRNWTYSDEPHIDTGVFQPQATLMSRNTLPLPAATALTNFGYLAVRRDPGQPIAVILSIEPRMPPARALDCKPAGCSLKIRLGDGPAVPFKAVPDKYMHRVTLRNGDAFVGAAARHTGRIEVQFQDLENGPATYHFTTGQPLDAGRIMTK